MVYIQLNKLLKYGGIIASGVIVGALFTGVAVRLPMLVEARWEDKTRHLKFDSREVRICDVKEIDTTESLESVVTETPQ